MSCNKEERPSLHCEYILRNTEADVVKRPLLRSNLFIRKKTALKILHTENKNAKIICWSQDER